MTTLTAKPNLFSTYQWLVILGSVLLAAVAVVAFVFGNFQTVHQAERDYQHFDTRLDHIEGKLDRALEPKGSTK